MREIHWKKLIGAASAAVLAATQVAPTISAFAEEASTGDYVYCYATMTWAEYWKNEGVYLDSAANGNWEASSAESDAHNETDMGAFDAVTRATSNHGLHRGSYQCAVKVFDTDGNSYDYTVRANPLMLSRIRRPAQQTLRLMEQLLVHTTILLSVVRSMFRLLFRQRITRTSRKLIPFTKTAQNSPAATLRAILSTLMRL